MQIKTCEIQEDKIEEAVRYAISNSFSLDELSRLLVMEGGVDLDSLARIIRENRGNDAPADRAPVEPQFIGKAANAASNVSPIRNWFGLKQAV